MVETEVALNLLLLLVCHYRLLIYGQDLKKEGENTLFLQKKKKSGLL